MHQLGPVVLVAASIMPIISKPLMYLFSQFDGLTEASMHFAAVLTVCSIVRSCQRLVTWQVFRPREFITSCVVVGHVSNDLVSLQKIFFFYLLLIWNTVKSHISVWPTWMEWHCFCDAYRLIWSLMEAPCVAADFRTSPVIVSNYKVIEQVGVFVYNNKTADYQSSVYVTTRAW